MTNKIHTYQWIYYFEHKQTSNPTFEISYEAKHINTIIILTLTYHTKKYTRELLCCMLKAYLSEFLESARNTILQYL